MERKTREIYGDQGIVTGAIRWLWRFFSSVRLAFALMMVIISLSLIGALILQAPSDVYADHQQYIGWLDNVAQHKYGAWTPLMSQFGFFGIFHSPWFLMAGCLLIVNIFICSINRWKRVHSILIGSPVIQDEYFYLNSTSITELCSLPKSPNEVVVLSSKLLKSHHYRVRVEHSGDIIYMVADKNRYFRLGTYLTHLSLILLVLGFLIGNYYGFRDTSFIVAEDTVQDVGHDTGLSLGLVSFVDEYWPDSTPKDYRSEVVIYEAGEETTRGIIRVNHPLNYKGIRFFQSFFGPSVTIQVSDDTGQIIHNSGIALTQPLESTTYQRYAGGFRLPEAGLIVWVIGTALNTPDPMIKKGEVSIQLIDENSYSMVTMDKLELGTSRKLGGLEFSFLQEGKYSGFQVSRDPGNVLIWIASSLFLLGIGMVLYFPHQQLWALAQPCTGGGSRLLVRSTSTRNLSAASELEKLIKELGLKSANIKE